MIIDLHNHTKYCNHATGEMEDYILRAIAIGIDEFGFSCHNPMDYDKRYRMSFEELGEYLDQIEYLQDKYAKQICIKKSLEIDFLPAYLDERVMGLDLDYRIGAIHFLDDWGFDNPEFIHEYAKRDINQCWEAYFKTTQSLAQSGLFDIVAHMDLLKIFEFFPSCDLLELTHETLNEIKKADMVVEVNTAGFRKQVKEQYPSLDILKICHQKKIPITFGSDAHEIGQIGFMQHEARELCRSIGFTECVSFTQREKFFIPF